MMLDVCNLYYSKAFELIVKGLCLCRRPFTLLLSYVVFLIEFLFAFVLDFSGGAHKLLAGLELHIELACS